MTVFLQMAPVGDGWLWHRAAGIKTRYRTLTYARMVARDLGVTLVLLNRRGERLD